MKSAQFLKKKITISSSDKTLPVATLTGSVMTWPGWISIDPKAKGDDIMVPATLKEGDTITLSEIIGTQKYTTPPNRYSEAGLVKELETRGIGRPSTFASTIKTIIDRGYVEKQDKALKPTDTGMVVSEFLENNFLKYISDTFTGYMEDKLDDISNGDAQYISTMHELYDEFHVEVEKKDTGEKVTNLGEADAKHICPLCGKSMVIKLGKTGRFLSCSTFPDCLGALTLEGLRMQEDEPLGIDPVTHLPVFLLSGRFGPYVQLGKKSDETPSPKRASIAPGLVDGITLESALHALILPRTLGNDPITGEEIIANTGRFGPYVGMGRNFRSLKKASPYEVTLEEAITLLAQPKSLPKGATLFRTIGLHPKTKKELQRRA